MDRCKMSLPVATVAPVHTFRGSLGHYLCLLCTSLPNQPVWFGQLTAERAKSNEIRCKLPFFKKYWFKMTNMDVPPAGGYQFPMVRYTDRDEEMKKDVSL